MADMDEGVEAQSGGAQGTPSSRGRRRRGRGQGKDRRTPQRPPTATSGSDSSTPVEDAHEATKTADGPEPESAAAAAPSPFGATQGNPNRRGGRKITEDGATGPLLTPSRRGRRPAQSAAHQPTEHTPKKTPLDKIKPSAARLHPRSAPTTPQKAAPSTVDVVAPSPAAKKAAKSRGGRPGGSLQNTPLKAASKSRKSRSRFDEYWDADQIKAGLAAGTVFSAALRVNPHRRREAYASITGFPQDALIDGERDQNRAFEGDIVYLELTAKKNGNQAQAVDAQSDSDEDEQSRLASALASKLTLAGTNEGQDESKEDPKRPKARVVGIAEALHRTKQFVGTFKSNSKNEIGEFVPTDKRAPIFFTPLREFYTDMQRDPQSFSNRLFVVEFLRWPTDSFRPRGRIVREVGNSGNLEAESLALLAEYSIDDRPHSEAMVRDLPTKMEITPFDEKVRIDLRSSERIFSIDPATTRDVDDALSIKPAGEGLWEVGVHIADVSHYVRPNSPLDLEAERRSTSTYLVDRCIPMLPPILSEVLCSINPKQDRFAFSVIWKLTDDGIIKDQQISKTIIRSCAKLAYDDAQVVIDTVEESGDPSSVGVAKIAAKEPEREARDIAIDILRLHKIAQRLRAARFSSGAIKLNRVKLYFDLDTSVSPPVPVSFRHYEQRTANELVEEFMLLANQSVAKFILETFPKNALLRRHPAPQERKLKEFLKLMDCLHIRIDATSGSAMLNSLHSQPAEHRPLLEDLMTRTMQPAVYFCTGDVTKPEDMHHYALNVPVYTHFTSPIRRYPDVIVHRLIAAALEYTRSKTAKPATSKPRIPIAGDKLTTICKNSNNRKLQARKAQERSQTVYLCILLQSKPITDDNCRVLEIGEKFVKMYSHTIGKAVRVFVGALEDRGVKTKWNEENKSLTLTWKDSSGAERSLALTYFQKLSVRFSASSNVPMDLEATLLLDGLALHLSNLESE